MQLAKLTPQLKVAHRKVLLNAVRNATVEELTITSFDGLPWRARAAARTLSVRVEGSEEVVSVVVRCDATVSQVVSAVQKATGTDGELLVWDGRRQARTKLASRHLRSLRKADPLVLVPPEPVDVPQLEERDEWGDGGGWSDDESQLESQSSPAADQPAGAEAVDIGGREEGGGPGQGDDMQIMDVKCPLGAAPGAMLMVTTSWGDVMQVIVPPGVDPGETFGVPCFPTPRAAARAPEPVS